MKNNYFSSLLCYSQLLIVLFFCDSFSQTFTSSNLPIIIITTDINLATNQPYEIIDDPDVYGTMKIIRHADGTRNFLTDQNTAAYLNYNGRLGIQIRGSSSQFLDKKAYKVTTLLADNISNNNVSLLGMPAENDWVLNGLAFDPSLIRDYLAYNLSSQMGNYAPRTHYCELVINGEYRGLYLLQEKIKADTNRVNVQKIISSDNTGINLSGGYITKADKTTGGDFVAWSNIAYNGQFVDYIHDLPKQEDVTFQQNAYIQNVFNGFQATMSANNSSLFDGYPTQIDVPTFVDFMLSNELAANADGYQFSTYFHKDRGGKLRAGPLWDFNLTLGNDLFLFGYDRSKVDTWQFSDGGNEGSKFWKDLFDNLTFKCYLSKRLNQLIQNGQPMNNTVLNTFIDATISLISEAMVRENEKWNTIPNNPLEIMNLKTFISNRIVWMSNQLGSFAACSNIAVPPLVITKINYNPNITAPFPSSNDQEYIEISNSSGNVVSLSGIYFKELGVSYQFPYNSTLAGNSSLYLAANAVTFLSRNGFQPFGQFSRNLSNKSQKLVLADAFGNLIDTVEYFDSAPWPTAADGSGSYLQLSNINLDNNLGTSWIASANPLEVTDFTVFEDLKIFPNPATSSISIVSKTTIKRVEIYDIFGKLIKSIQVDAIDITVEISSFSSGMYFVKVDTENGTKTQKCFKY